MRTVLSLVSRYDGSWRTDLMEVSGCGLRQRIGVVVGSRELCAAAASLAPRLAGSCASGLELVSKLLHELSSDTFLNENRDVTKCQKRDTMRLDAPIEQTN